MRTLFICLVNVSAGYNIIICRGGVIFVFYVVLLSLALFVSAAVGHSRPLFCASDDDDDYCSSTSMLLYDIIIIIGKCFHSYVA